MHRMLFINLPVVDVQVSTAFYTGLGFAVQEQFCDASTACIMISPSIYVMLLARPRFADFVRGEVGDPARATTVINCLSTGSRGEVQDLVERALASGGRPWRDPMDEGFMYGHSFADPDGHVWEAIFMAVPGP